MQLQEKINQVENENKAVKKKFSGLKNEFSQYITNKDISVSDRWNFFINAPSKLKNSFSGVATFNSKILKNYMQNFLNGPGSPRGEKIVMEEVLEDYAHPDITSEELDYLAENYLGCDNLTKEDVEEAMEEVLSKNLEYFTYDW